MNKFIKTLSKYVVLFIIQSLFGMPWFYIRWLLIKNFNYDYDRVRVIDSIPSYADYLIIIISIILLIIDFKKYNLKGVVFACIGALFAPLLGVMIFAILLLLEEKKLVKQTNNKEYLDKK